MVFGVAFEDENDFVHTQAAELSITEVPGTKVIYKGVGSDGFFQACKDAVDTDIELPEIKLKPAPESHRRNIDEAIAVALEKNKKK